MKNYARHLWLSLLLLVGVTAIAVPGLNETNEDSPVAKIGETGYPTLQAAFNAATDGQTVTLMADYNAANESMAGGTRQFVINKSITFDGGGYTLTTKDRGIGVGNVNDNLSNNINVTIKNITIANSSSGARCIDTRGKIGSLTLDGVTLNTQGASGTTQPLTIGGNQKDKATITITNSTIQTNEDGTAYYAIITFNPVNMTISNSTLKGWACIYAKDADSSAGSASSVFTLENCTLLSTNKYKNESNSFGAIQINDNNVTVNVTNSNITIQNKYDQKQGIACISSTDKGLKPATYTGSKITLGEGNTVTFNNMEGATGSCEYILNQGENTFEISGGTFNADPTPYLAEGHEAVENNGTWTVREKTYIAQIDGTRYESLEAAFAEVKNGETVTLLDNVALSTNLELALEGKNVTLDLGGNTLNGRTNLKSGSLTIQNGKIVATGDTQALNVYGSDNPAAENYSVLTIASDVIVDAEMFGVCMFGKTATTAGYGAVVNIAGEVKTAGTGKEGTVFVSGNLGQNIAGDMKNVINITGKVTSTNDAGVALNGNATVNVKSDAKITGNTGIAVKRGVLNVEEGATVHATGAENLNPGANNNGTEMTGAAISMTDTYNNYGAMSVNITGGTFTSDNTIALFKKEANYTNDATYSVSGGTFSSAVPAEFCAPGYEPKDLGNGQYSVYAPAYSVTVNKVDPKTDWYMGMTTSAIQFSITKDGSVLSTKDQYTEQLDKWDIILDENYLQLKSKVAAAKWIRCNLTPVGTGTTTVVFQNKANPSIKVEQEVTITHKLILVVQPSGTHMVEAGPVEIGGNTKFDGVKIEDYSQFTFTSSDETIATISGTKITPLKSGTITVTVTKNDDPSATASANITFIDAPAKIGETYYESIGKALKAAKSGETITLLRDVTESTSFSGEQPRVSDFALTIDLNGHTWTGASQPYTLKMEYGVITIKDSQGGGGVKYGNDYAFIVSHLAAEYPSKLILENGTFTGKTSVAQVGLSGGSGSNKKYYGGDLVVNGGTFVTVPDEGETYDENGNFKYTLNMLDMAESSYPGGIYSPSTITVNGGKFLKFDPQNNLAEGTNTNFVPEGLVSTKSVESGEAWYTISKIVAKIDETTYTSLADAFTAATDGQTITVLTDIDLPSTIAVTKQVTLDLAGKKIFNTSDLWDKDKVNWSFFSVQANGNLTVTGDGTIDAKENDCYTFDVRDGGILTIKNGTFTGNISCVYLTNEAGTGVSTCNIEGGTFSIKQLANNVQDDKYRYLLNCYDAFYKNNTAKFNVTGGSFVNFNPANNQAEGVATNFCAAGYEAVQNDNVWTVQKAPVAQIDNEMYYSLADAFADATDGETITLLTNVELTDRLFVNAGATPEYNGTDKRFATTTENKSITLDLSGYNVTTSSNIALAGGSLNIVNNGTADATHGVISTTNAGLAPIEIRGTGDLTQKRTLTVGTGVTLSGAEYGLNVFGSNNEQKNIIDVNVNGTVNGTLFVLGNLKNAENEININVAGTVYVPDNGDDEASVGVALNGIATVNVNEGAQVSGETGIEVRAGNLIVNGGNIKATATEYSVNPNGSGTTTTGAAIAIAQHTTGLPINANITGGTLSGPKSISVADPQGLNYTGVVVTAKDELTEGDVVIPDGYIWVSNNNGTSTLKTKEDAGIFVLEDGKNYPYLNYTDDKDATSVSYFRTFNNAKWQSLYIPFDINDVTQLTDKYEFAKVHMVAYATDENGVVSSDRIRLYYIPITSGTIYANKPYLIKLKNQGDVNKQQEIKVENTKLCHTQNINDNPMICSTTNADYLFKGTYRIDEVTAVPNEPSTHFFGVGGGSINYIDNRTLSSYRWYIKVNPRDIHYAKPTFEFVMGDEDATGISIINNDDMSEIEGYYTVNGIRSDVPVKGMNIVKYKNGKTKKVMIK